MADQLLRDVSSYLRGATNDDGNVSSRSIMAAETNEITDLRRSDRRQDRREIRFEACTYELFDTRGCEALTHECGEAYTLNQSREGIMLLMDHAPRTRQYLEVHIEGSMGRHEINVCEVAWTKPLPIESDDDYYMVGCHRVMEPCRYLQF